MSIPNPDATDLASLVEAVVDRTKHLAGNELAVLLDVSESYVTKLRKGFRPERMHSGTRRRFESMLVDRQPNAAASPSSDVAFAAGVLWSIERDARHIAETAREARKRLGYDAPGITPSAPSIAAGLSALRTSRLSESDPEPKSGRKGRG